MNLNRLYDLLASRAGAGDVINLPAWADMAAAAEFHPLEGTGALRALLHRGLVEQLPTPAPCGGHYVLRRPLPDCVDALRAMLRVPDGASVRHLLAPRDPFPDPKAIPSDELFRRFDMATGRPWCEAKHAKLIEWADEGATVWLAWDDGALRCTYYDDRAEAREWLASNGFSVPARCEPTPAPAIF